MYWGACDLLLFCDCTALFLQSPAISSYSSSSLHILIRIQPCSFPSSPPTSCFPSPPPPTPLRRPPAAGPPRSGHSLSLSLSLSLFCLSLTFPLSLTRSLSLARCALSLSLARSLSLSLSLCLSHSFSSSRLSLSQASPAESDGFRMTALVSPSGPWRGPGPTAQPCKPWWA